jgi:serine/threonine protein kinase/tetratricopeptide (TPR) repeat protein
MLMSEAKEQNNKRPNEGEATRSLNGSGIGPGSQIGSFRIEQELGRGAAGVVYLAHDTKLDRSVAIKSLPAELMENSKARTRFAREARVLASLNHPNIATIYDELRETEGVGYLILEYVPGRTLAERIAGTKLKPQEALSIAQQIAEAVAAAHEHDVIHRDLKPGNIKITPEGKVKVLDFGLAKALGDETTEKQSTITEPGRIIGTPAYMSPEQARGQATDKRCDIWSFGCVLYEMLTGKVPFEGETISDILTGILDCEPDWHALPQTTPANIQVLLRRCLEKDPHRRLHDIADAAIEINETLNLPATAPPVTIPSISLTPHIAVKVRSRRIAMVIAVTVIIALSAIAVLYILEQRSVPTSEKMRMVVLPFENLGLAEDDYFTDGVTEEITSRLSVIHSLGVISRTSATQYKKSDKTIRQIGEELGVEYVLEGTVRWERPAEGPSQVRVTPQLIRVSDDTHLWSDRYDAVLANIFEVQSDIAEKVANALDIALLEPERQVIEYKPTENTEAYTYYMRGNDYQNRSLIESDLIIAIQMYEKAVELDPEYALAYAQLSRCHAAMYWQYYSHTPQRLEMAEKNVRRALQLGPDLPEVHLALGHYYYNCRSDWDQALHEFAVALKSLPNDSDLLSYIGYVRRRQGKFREALADIKSASELAYKLNPCSNNITNSLGETFMYIRDYPEAMRCFEKAISLTPDNPRPYGYKASLYLLWEGSTKKARAVVEKALALESVGSPETSPIYNRLINLDVYDGNYQDALRRISLRSEDTDTQDFFIPVAMQYASVYGYMKNDLAKKYYDEGLKIVEAKIRQEPNDARLHSALGIAYAGLGRRQEAIREGKLAVDLLPVSKDAMRGICRVDDLARIYMMVGDFDLAVDQIAFLLSIPSELSINLLRLDPAWNPLRGHARFQKLLEGK